MILNQNKLYLFLIVFFAFILVSCNQKNYGSKYSSNVRTPKKERKSVYTSKPNIAKSKSTPEAKIKTSSHLTKPTVVGKRAEVIETAFDLLGKNYRSGGKRPETGFDCSGFTSFVFSQNGIQLKGPSHDQAKLGKPKKLDQLIPGDLIFFGNSERISHVGIVARNEGNICEVVHSTTSAGVKVDNITQSEYWMTRFLFGVNIIE